MRMGAVVETDRAVSIVDHLTERESRVFYKALNAVRLCNGLKEKARMGVALVEVGNGLVEKTRIYWVLTDTEPGSLERRLVTDRIKANLRRDLGSMEDFGFDEFPDPCHRRPANSLLRTPNWDEANTYFCVQSSKGDAIMVVVPSIDSPSRNKFLSNQKRRGRKVVWAE